MCFCLEESIYFHGGISKISYKYYFAFAYDVQRNDNSSLTEIGERITQVSDFSDLDQVIWDRVKENR